jgi:hypothetical protein
MFRDEDLDRDAPGLRLGRGPISPRRWGIDADEKGPLIRTSQRHRGHVGPRIIHPVALVLALLLALNWNGTSAAAGVCCATCLVAVTAYLVYILVAILRGGLTGSAVPAKRPLPSGLWDRDLDGERPI